MAAPRKPNVDLLLTGETLSKVRAILDPYLLTDEQVHRVMTTLDTEMKNGLCRDPVRRKLTPLMMENTYVRSLLDGTENGKFLALDLGGTNFRILLVQMKDGKCESHSRNYNVPAHKLIGPARDLFDHLAESIYKFMKEDDLLGHRLPLGFTFSFPMTQKSLKIGVLSTWTKSFKCTDGVGKDAVKMLEDAIKRRAAIRAGRNGFIKQKEVLVDVVAILNDTTGTLLAGSYLHHDCKIGLILGTGCNAAYIETLDNVDKWEGPRDGPKQVVIDTEWGAFGDNGSLDFMKTSVDKMIDHHSHHSGSYTFEKLFSGHYIGDIVRLVLLKLVSENLVCEGHVTEKLTHWKSVTARHISNIERDTDTDLTHTKQLLCDLDLDMHASEADLSVIRYLCAAVSIRAAQLISASLSALMNHMKLKKTGIAIDGSLYKYHPNLHRMMKAWMSELSPQTEATMFLAEDGSGRGAGFAAAVAVKQALKSSNR